MMKQMIKVLAMLIIGIIAFSSCTKVPAGHKGVKVYLLGQKKGVDHEVLDVGRYWRGINVEYYKYPTFTQNYVWTVASDEGKAVDESINFQTMEGLALNGDFGITYRVDPSQVSILFETFRRGIDEITNTFLRNMVRDGLNKYASTMDVESAYGKGKNELISSVEKYVTEQVEEKGIIVEKIYVIGNFRLPDNVKKALDAKISATQKAQQRENEVKEAEAKAKKDVAYAKGKADAILLKAKAEAEANIIVAKSITPQLIQYEKIKAWDGMLPKVTSDGGTLIDLR